MRPRGPIPFWATDWLTSPTVLVMPLDVQGSYFRMLCFCWCDPDCGVRDDQLDRLSLLTDPDALAMLREQFAPHPEVDGKLINRRLFDIAQEAERFSEERRRSGAKGGRPKKVGQTSGKPQPNPPTPTPTPLPLPLPSPSSSTFQENHSVSEVVSEVGNKTAPRVIHRVPTRCTTTDAVTALLDAHERGLKQHQGIVARAASTKTHREVAREVLESCNNDLGRALAVVDLYTSWSGDRWIVDRAWGFRWLSSRLPTLLKLLGERETGTTEAARRAALADLRELRSKGADVDEEIARLEADG